MSSGATHDPDDLRELAALAEGAQGAFPVVGFLGPGGVLTVPVDDRTVTTVRLDIRDQFLHLQSIELTGPHGEDLTKGAIVTASSWYGRYGDRFDPAVLFDFAHPTGTQVHTEQDAVSWVEIRLARPSKLTRIRLRNVSLPTATRAQKLRVSTRGRFGLTTVHFDGAEESRSMRLWLARRADDAGLSPVAKSLIPTLELTLTGQYPAAVKALKNVRDLDDSTHSAFRALVNAELLPARELLWTIHGPHRSFRFWTPNEQAAYVSLAVELADTLRELTPHVSFGFGAVLSVIRDRALIPHDDDLDLVIGFEPEEAATLAEGLALVESFLAERGWATRGAWSAHRQVGRANGKRVDVFVGLFEGEKISWYPGPRGTITRTMMYPTGVAPLLGIECPVPAQPEAYLEAVYGPGWNRSDPNFRHTWNRSAYADLAGSTTKGPGGEAGATTG